MSTLDRAMKEGHLTTEHLDSIPEQEFIDRCYRSGSCLVYALLLWHQELKEHGENALLETVVKKLMDKFVIEAGISKNKPGMPHPYPCTFPKDLIGFQKVASTAFAYYREYVQA